MRCSQEIRRPKSDTYGDTEGDGQVRMEAEIGVMCLHTKECPGSPTAHGRSERGMGWSLQKEPVLPAP